MPARDSSRPTAATRNAARRRVLALLKDEHRALATAFRDAELAGPGADPAAQRARVLATIAQLERHAALEAALFYPEIRPAAGERVDEAEVEHSAMATLAAQIRAGDPTDPRQGARFKVLGEYLRHHVAEEEGTLFAALERADLPWEALAGRMAVWGGGPEPGQNR